MTEALVDYDSEEFRKLGAVLAALVEVREAEIVSACKEVMDAAFPDSVGRLVIQALREAREPLNLRAIADRCDTGRRSVLPEGRVRVVVSRLAKAGIVVNVGTEEKPRYLLDEGDKRVRILAKLYGPIRVAQSATRP
jgi:hypothetical protein